MRFSLPAVVVLCTFVPIILSRVTPRALRTEHTEHNNVDLKNRYLNPRQTYGNCTAAATRIRREWWAWAILVNFRFGRKDWHRTRRTLSKMERRSYIDAVLCLQKKPSIYKDVVGAKSRFDDFQIEHIAQAYDIHFNVRSSFTHITSQALLTRSEAKFTAWHRWFVWEYESLLIKECDYQGAQPYVSTRS